MLLTLRSLIFAVALYLLVGGSEAATKTITRTSIITRISTRISTKISTKVSTRVSTVTRVSTSTKLTTTTRSITTVITRPPLTVTRTLPCSSSCPTKPAVTITSTYTKPASTVTLPGSTVTLPKATITLPGSTITQPASTITLPASTITTTVTSSPTPSEPAPRCGDLLQNKGFEGEDHSTEPWQFTPSIPGFESFSVLHGSVIDLPNGAKTGDYVAAVRFNSQFASNGSPFYLRQKVTPPVSGCGNELMYTMFWVRLFDNTCQFTVSMLPDRLFQDKTFVRSGTLTPDGVFGRRWVGYPEAFFMPDGASLWLEYEFKCDGNGPIYFDDFYLDRFSSN